MKKIFSFVIVMAAAALVGCAGNTTKKAAEAEAAEAPAVEAAAPAQEEACGECAEGCTGNCESCSENEKAEGECCNK